MTLYFIYMLAEHQEIQNYGRAINIWAVCLEHSKKCCQERPFGHSNKGLILSRLIHRQYLRFVSQTGFRLSKSKEIDAENKRPTRDAQSILRCTAAKCPLIRCVHLGSQCAGAIQWGQPGVLINSLGFVSCSNWRRPLLGQGALPLEQCGLNPE